MKIEIKYNTIAFKAEVKCDNSTVENNLKQAIIDIEDKPIIEWFDVFLNRIFDDINNEDFSLCIEGCDEVEVEYIKTLLETIHHIKIDYKVSKANIEKIRIQYEAVDQFVKLVSSSNNEIIQEVYQEHIENIALIQSNKVEIPVIATMSAGKSTLLNALIGQNLLPAKNKATTATTCEIKVNNTLDSFKGIVYRNYEKLLEQKDVQSSFIREWNEKANEDSDITICIEGPVRNLDTHNFNLSFVDTPGPNNSQNEKHTDSIYTYLKDSKNLPILLFVLNAQQLGVNDEKLMLEEIKKVIDEKKESLDRILFVLNRIDENKVFDKENPERVKDTIEEVRVNLERFGIRNAKIFPISAEYARLSQLDLDDDDHDDEIDTLDKFRKRIRPNQKREGFELVENSPLTLDQKQFLLNRVCENELNADLVYSGLAGLKLYIETYIKNHHKKRQYKQLYDISQQVYRTILSSVRKQLKDLYSNTNDNIAEKEEERKQQIEVIKKNNKNLIEELKKLMPIKPPFEKEKIEIIRKSNSLMNRITKNDNCSINEANTILNEINREISNAKISIKTSLIAKINECFDDRVNSLKKLAKGYYTDESKDADVNYFNSKMLNSITTVTASNLSNYQSTKVEKITKWEDRTFLGTKSFFGISFGKKEVVYLEDKVVVNLLDFYNENAQPLFMALSKTINEAQSNFENEIKSIDSEFIRRIEEFNQTTQDKIFKDFKVLIEKDEKIKRQLICDLEAIENKIGNVIN